MNLNWLELVIILFIITGIGVAIRHARNNPSSTGQLSRRITKVETTVKGQSVRIDHLESAIEKLAANTATKDDVRRLEQLIERDSATSEKTWQAIKRIEDFFLAKGMGGK